MTVIDQAMIFAAGEGQRMRPLTNDIPKTMVPVLGKPIIDHILGHMAASPVRRCVINSFYKADVLENHLRARQKDLPFDIIISREDRLLETGGGLKYALAHIDTQKPLYAVNGDAFWINAPEQTTLDALSRAWDDARMDILLLLQPVDSMRLTQGVGDYILNPDGTVTRSLNQSGTHMFAGTRILHPRIFARRDWPDYFSFLKMMDAAQEDGRLYGLVHKGIWHHLSTPQDVARVDRGA